MGETETAGQVPGRCSKGVEHDGRLVTAIALAVNMPLLWWCFSASRKKLFALKKNSRTTQSDKGDVPGDITTSIVSQSDGATTAPLFMPGSQMMTSELLGQPCQESLNTIVRPRSESVSHVTDPYGDDVTRFSFCTCYIAHSFLLPHGARYFWQELSFLSSIFFKLQWPPGLTLFTGSDTTNELGRRDASVI